MGKLLYFLMLIPFALLCVWFKWGGGTREHNEYWKQYSLFKRIFCNKLSNEEQCFHKFKTFIYTKVRGVTP